MLQRILWDQNSLFVFTVIRFINKTNFKITIEQICYTVQLLLTLIVEEKNTT